MLLEMRLDHDPNGLSDLRLDLSSMKHVSLTVPHQMWIGWVLRAAVASGCVIAALRVVRTVQSAVAGGSSALLPVARPA
jgi:hypothetical protein